MGQTLRYRLFGIGAMPAAARASFASETLLCFSEGVPVTFRRNGTVPGRLIWKGTRSMSGALAVTNGRVVASVSRLKVIDLPFAPACANGAGKLEIAADGMEIRIELERAVAGGKGEMSLRFHRVFSDAELAQVPARFLSFEVTEASALHLFRRVR